LTREEILDRLSENLDDGAWFLRVLKQHTRLSKEQLKDLVNEQYKQMIEEKNKEKDDEEKTEVKKLVNSRHVLDVMTARLEGAGLVKVTHYGRARVYELSDLAIELINYRNSTNE